MEIKIALAGNPNCGKTTLFNDLTGSSQYVGNWPGVTVEKKEGRLRGRGDVVIQDLPGIYSLSPYTLEETLARSYLVGERPDAVLNIVDGTNMERNLYLTTQLLELGLPVVVALNMTDLVRKNGGRVDTQKLGEALGCTVTEISALRREGSREAAELAVQAAEGARSDKRVRIYTGSVERALAGIEEAVAGKVEERYLRWYAVKLFERDEKVWEELAPDGDLRARLEAYITECERELDDDAESIITNQRYDYIGGIVSRAVRKKEEGRRLSVSDRIDRVVTNRVAALPIFVCVMFLIYAVAMGGWGISIGARGTDWANDGLFGDGWFLPFTADLEAWEADSAAFGEAAAVIEAYEAGDSEAYFYDGETGETAVIPVDAERCRQALAVPEPDPRSYGTWVPGLPVLIERALSAAGCGAALSSLVLDGIVGGVGAVLGFVPQMLVLFFLLALLEDVGYMARVAFIMDRIFRRFGLSGKSFIPMLVATGCGVPGIMASRTIEQERDRRMTIMTTGFIPCGAKTPIIALFAGAIFGGSPLAAVSAFFIGAAAVVLSGIMLKKCRAFAGEPAPFVMELPAYHLPAMGGVLRAAWERGWSFIKRAGTIILLSSIVLWFLQGFGFTENGFGMVEDNNASLLASAGSGIAFIFRPLGFGTWQAAVAAVTGLIAKEEVVNTLGVLFPGNLTANIAGAFTAAGAYSFLIFNLLCAPCFAAMGAIRREMNSAKWTLAAIGYMCGFAYGVSLMVYQLGGLAMGERSFGPGTAAALAVLAGMLYLLFRKGRGTKTRPAPVPAAGI